ncbi:MAG: hypothetical protein V4591_10495 [Bdellovibrionota bacterium]
MLDKKNSSDMLNDLRKANKYIFVQDFVKAEKILKLICLEHEDEYEAYFRRVEIAEKSNKLDKLLLDFSEQEQKFPNSKALGLAFLLAKIKKYTSSKQTALPIEVNFRTNENFFPNNQKVISIQNKKIKLHRNVNFPDDIVKIPEQSLSLISQNIDQTYFDTLVEKAFVYYKNDPENYATCYVAGCVLDNLGNRQEAIYKWKKALTLNPTSVCSLSILAELQQEGHFHEPSDDFCLRLESLDKHLVHGHIATHTDLYNDFIVMGDYKNAIASLKILTDWIYKQYGSIPIEIEIICLLGIMNAYKLDKNVVASESCRNEVENIIIAYLTNPNVDVQIMKEIATHCVNQYSSEALLLTLKKAYENSKGHQEIRFCLILCALNLKKINVDEYMENKNKIRQFISQNKTNEALPLLENLVLNFKEDPETQYYLAEIYSRNNAIVLAKTHFQIMYSLDAFHTEAMTKYVYFLLKNKFYKETTDIAENTLKKNSLTPSQANEIRWCSAAAYFAQEKYELSQQEISKCVASEPWNISYISLFIRCCLHLTDHSTISESFFIIAKIDEFSLANEKFPVEKKEKLIQDLNEYSQFCLRKGFYEIAWSFAKCSLVVGKKLDEKISEIISRTAAAYLSPTTIPQLLVLLKKQSEIDASFFEITSCIAKTYGLIGQWELVDEWLAMAQNYPVEDKIFQSKLFELEALSIAMQGSDLKKAQNILEAAIDCYDTKDQVPFETKILHGYLLVTQGNIAVGIEKMQNNINENSSIQSLYFFVKGCERAGILSSLSQESIEQMRHASPLNVFEQKMIEEIFFTVSSKINLIPLGLAC